MKRGFGSRHRIPRNRLALMLGLCLLAISGAWFTVRGGNARNESRVPVGHLQSGSEDQEPANLSNVTREPEDRNALHDSGNEVGVARASTDEPPAKSNDARLFGRLSVNGVFAPNRYLGICDTRGRKAIVHRTDGDGMYEFVVPSGEYLLRVHSRGDSSFDRHSVIECESIAIPVGETRHDVYLTESEVLVRVVDDKTGLAVANAELEFTDAGELGRRYNRTWIREASNSEGLCQLSLPFGGYGVVVKLGDVVVAIREFEVREVGCELTLNVTTPASGLLVRGRLSDGTRSGIVDHWLRSVRLDSIAGVHGSYSAPIGLDGSFSIMRVPPGEYFVSLEPGVADWQRTIVMVSEANDILEIDGFAESQVHGRLIVSWDESSQVPDNANRLIGRQPVVLRGTAIPENLHWPSWEVGARRCDFARVPVGEYDLCVMTESGFERDFRVIGRVSVAVSETRVVAGATGVHKQ